MKTNKIKVLVSGPSTEGGKGGQVTHMQNIKSTFSGHEIYQVKHFVSSSALEEGESSLKKVILMLVRSAKFPFCLLKASVVHINSSLDNKALFRDMVLMSWSMIFSKRVIIQYHGGDFSNTVFSRNKFLKKLWSSFLKSAKQILVLTDQQLELMQDCGITHVKKVANYVSCSEAELQRPKVFTFIFLSRLIRSKGVFDILNACIQLNNSHDFNVLFYGDGPDRIRLTDEIKALGLSDKVSWQGMVEGAGKEAAYTNANAFLLPSYAEGLPYSVLEAMSYGLPVISTDVGSLTQLVKHQETGLIVNINDAQSLAESMVLLMDNPVLLASLSKASKSHIQDNYSNQKMKSVFSEVWSIK